MAMFDLIIHLLIYNQRLCPSPHTILNVFKKAKKVIDTDISRHFSIASLAETSGIGATGLKRGFKQLYGLGLFAYLQKQRMLQAAALLTDTDKTIKQITRLTGFRDRSNFTTAFSSYYGTPPGRYRKQHSNR
jgi:AraC-like DNA-binding protein